MDTEGRYMVFTAMTTLITAAMLAGGHKLDAQLIPKALAQVDRILAEGRARFPDAVPILPG